MAAQLKNLTQDELYDEILEYLEINNICTIALAYNGIPRAIPVEYRNDGQTCMLSRKAKPPGVSGRRKGEGCRVEKDVCGKEFPLQCGVHFPLFRLQVNPRAPDVGQGTDLPQG